MERIRSVRDIQARWRPFRHVSAMERAAFLDDKAKREGRSVGELISPANAWKSRKSEIPRS